MRREIRVLCSVLTSSFLVVLIPSCAFLSNSFTERNPEAGKYQKDIENVDWDSIWFSEEIRNTTYKNKIEKPKEPLKWNEFRDFLSKKSLNERDIRKFESKIRSNGSLIEDEQVGEAIRVFNNLSDRRLRSLLFESLGNNSFPKSLEVHDFLLEIAKSNDKDISPKALSTLLSLENEVGENGQDRWDDWSWSPELQALLEQAVDKDLYKLSSISLEGELVLLRLFERYPDSNLTKGAQLYGQIAGGETYIGAYSSLPTDIKPPVLRTPINSSELETWSSFLEKYPNHPASDNVMYRIGRIHELEGNYSDALVSYYQASQMPDGALRDVAKIRTLFIADSLMNSDSVNKLSKDTEFEELVPFLQYTTAIHLIREGKTSIALEQLRGFSEEYKPKSFSGFVTPNFVEGGDIYPSSLFWENVERQTKNLKFLLKIQAEKDTDSKAYKEASFWFYNQLTAYNYLWRGKQSGAFGSFLPFIWDSESVSSIRLLNYDMVDNAGNAYDNQFGYLLSIKRLEELLKNYPESKFQEKALYSILVNYYWSYVEGGAISLDVASQWQDKARRYIDEDSSYSYFNPSYIWQAAVVDTAYRFIEIFPSSSMADDALLTVGEVGSESESVQALRKLISDYPDSDRIKEAGKMLEMRESL
jgi:hypothetical protein